MPEWSVGQDQLRVNTGFWRVPCHGNGALRPALQPVPASPDPASPDPASPDPASPDPVGVGPGLPALRVDHHEPEEGRVELCQVEADPCHAIAGDGLGLMIVGGEDDPACRRGFDLERHAVARDADEFRACRGEEISSLQGGQNGLCRQVPAGHHDPAAKSVTGDVM